MFTLTKWIAAPVLAMGLMFAADAPNAKAQYGYGYHGGGGGFSLSIGRTNSFRGYQPYIGGYGSSYGSAYRPSYRSSFGSYGLPSIHRGHGRSSRGHFDWHPTTVVRHGNHYDVQPGHFDFHRGHH